MMRRALLSALLLCVWATAADPAMMAGSGNGGTPVAPAGETLVAIRNLKNWDGSATPSTFYQTLEQCFAEGAVPDGNIVEVRKGDGTTVMSSQQADNRILWADDSLRCARFMFEYPSQLSASGTDTLKFYSKTGAWDNTPWATATTTILAQDFLMQFVASATTYTCGVNNEINRGNYRSYAAGPTAVGLVVHGVFRNGTASGSTDQGHAHCRIYVTAWENGDFTIMGIAYSCRSTSSTCAAISTTSAALKNGGSTLWSYAPGGGFDWFGGTYFATADTDGQPYYSGTTVREVVAAFPEPVLANPETTTLWDARLTPPYGVSAGAIALMDPSPNAITYTPMAMGDYVGQDFNTTGASPWIGWMPSSSAVAMWMGDWESLRQDTINALASGAQQWYFNDATNGNPLNLNGGDTYPDTTQNSSISWGVAATISTTGGSPYGANQRNDSSHLPAFMLFPMLYSGEEWWLDLYQDVVVGLIGAQNPNTGVCWTRNPTINSTQWWAVVVGPGYQVRQQAWLERDLKNVAWLTPTSHPLYQMFQDLVTQNQGAAEATITGPTTGTGCLPFSSDWASLGLYLSTYNAGTGVANAPWMFDYWTQGLVLSVLRGQLSASSILITDVLTKFIVGRAYDAGGGCAYAAAAYNFNIAVNNGNAASTPPWATDWSEVWAGTAGGSDTITTGGQFTDIDGTGCPSSGLSSFTDPFSQTTYPNILLGAARLAKFLSITGASSAVTRFEAEKTAQGCCSDAQVAGQPQWSIVEPQ